MSWELSGTGLCCADAGSCCCSGLNAGWLRVACSGSSDQTGTDCAAAAVAVVVVVVGTGGSWCVTFLVGRTFLF